MITDLDVTMTLQGASGKTYLFNLFGYSSFAQLHDVFRPLQAIYVFSRRFFRDGAFSHTLIYLGQTSDLSTRFNNHHKETEIGEHYGNCIWIHVCNGTDKQREEEEKDLLDAYDFLCNEANN